MKDHVDFKTWVRRQVGKNVRRALKGAGTLATSLRLAGVPLAALGSAFEKVGNCLPIISAWIWVLAFMVLALFMPRPKPTAKYFKPPEQVTVFASRWTAAWVLMLAAHTLKAVAATFAATKHPDHATASGILSSIAFAFASWFILGCFVCLARVMHKDDHTQQILKVEPVIMLVPFALIVLTVLSALLGNGAEGALLRDLPSSVACALALALLIGRLDSKLIGLPVKIVPFLYLAALVAPVSVVLQAWSGETDAAAALLLHGTEALMSVIRIPLEMLLFIVVQWCVHGRAFERYLTNIDQVGFAACWRPPVSGEIGRELADRVPV